MFILAHIHPANSSVDTELAQSYQTVFSKFKNTSNFPI